MIFKSLFFFALVALVGGVVHFGASVPGQVVVQWFGVEVIVNPVFAVLVSAFLGVLLFLAGRVWAWLVYVPKLLETWRLSRHAREEIHTLVAGMEALLLEDKTALQRLGHTKFKNPESAKLIPYFKAEIAEQKADYKTAEQNFATMLSDKTTTLLGLKGLIQLAERQENWQEVHTLATRALKLRPGTQWALKAQLNALVKLHSFEEALGALPALYKYGALGLEELDSLTVYLNTSLAEMSQPKVALKRLEKALKTQPDFVPAIVLKASTFHQLGKERAAEKWLEANWQKTGSTEVFGLWKTHINSLPVAKKIKRVQALTKSHMGTMPGHLALAEIYMEAEKYPEARVHFLEAADIQETPEILQRLSELEDKIHPGSLKGYDWLKKAMELPKPNKCHPTVEAYQTWKSLSAPKRLAIK